MNYDRCNFIKTAAAGSIAAAVSPKFGFSSEKTLQVEILNPQNRVSVSLIIDDSTCLVNMAHFGITQFAEVFPENYKQDWRKLPCEIPDSFVREFGEWSQNKSAGELASYQAYVLQILKDAGLTCEGVTTPGGYGSKNMNNLALGTLESVRDVYGVEIPHFFRDLFTEKGKSVAPQVLYASNLESNDPKCVVSVIGCTGDWFGGWDGLVSGDVNNFITKELLKINSNKKRPVFKNAFPFKKVSKPTKLAANAYFTDKNNTVICFYLAKGTTEIGLE